MNLYAVRKVAQIKNEASTFPSPEVLHKKKLGRFSIRHCDIPTYSSCVFILQAEGQLRTLEQYSDLIMSLATGKLTWNAFVLYAGTSYVFLQSLRFSTMHRLSAKHAYGQYGCDFIWYSGTLNILLCVLIVIFTFSCRFCSSFCAIHYTLTH